MNDDDDDEKVWVTISPEAHAAIAAATVREFKAAGRRLPDGNWTIPLRPATMRRLVLYQFPNEKIGDTILRIMLTSQYALH